MTFLDLILILLVFGFVLAGLWFGFIHSLGALIGNIFGVLVAGHYYEPWAQATQGLFFGNLNLARVVMFFLIMVLVNRLIGVVFWVVEKIFKIVSVIPFLKTINALAGGILGFLEGVIVVGGSLYIAARYPIGASFADALTNSKIGLALLKAFGLFAPLLPEIIRNLKSVV